MTQNCDKTQQPFTTNQQPGEKETQQQRHSGSAYREVVMKQARRHLGIDDGTFRGNSLEQRTISAAQPHNDHESRLLSRKAHSTYDSQRIMSYDQSSPSRLQQQFLSTGDHLRSPHAFDEVTPGRYEETEQPFTYSMYTETVLGHRSSEKSHAKACYVPIQQQRDGFESIGTSDHLIHATLNHKPDLSQALQKSATGAFKIQTATSPEREIFAEGYDTAMFAKHHLQRLATGHSSGTKKPPKSINRHHSSVVLEEEDSIQLTKGKLLKQQRHIHSDSIMSAQFIAESAPHVMSQEINASQQRQRPEIVQQMFTQRNAHEERRNEDRQGQQTRGLSSNVMSNDRKTFTLGGQLVMSGQGVTGSNTSKSDMQSIQYQHFGNSSMEVLSRPQLNPVTQLAELQMQITANKAKAPEYKKTDRNISSDYKEYLMHMEHKNQEGSISQRCEQRNAQMAVQNQKIDGPLNTMTYQTQGFSPFDFPLSQPYQMSDHMQSLITLERGVTMTPIGLQNQGGNMAFTNSYHPSQLIGHSGINQATISDPSIQFPSQSQLYPQGNFSSQGQMGQRMQAHQDQSQRFEDPSGIGSIGHHYQHPSPSPNRVNQKQMSLNTQRATRNQMSIDMIDNTPMSQRNNLTTLQHNLSQVTSQGAVGGNHAILKQEIILLRKQLNDSRSSQLFLKKQLLQLQHTINMQNISLSQMQEAVGAKDSVQEQDQAKLDHLEARYEEQRKLGEDLLRKQEQSEEIYRQRLQMFNEELEHMRAEKMKSGYRIQANVMQLTSAMQHLAETVGDQSSFLTPFLAHFDKVCQTLMAQVGAMTYTLNGSQSEQSQYDSRYQLKMMKRAHNFEKFRKEIRSLCKNHYRAKIHERDIELEKALKHIKMQERQSQKLNEVCESMRASYEQAQENIKSLNEEKHRMAQIFDEERLRLEKMHLQEIARLHQAVKGMKKRTIQFPNQETIQTIGQTKTIDMETRQTVDSNSEAFTTLDHCAKSAISTVPSQEIFQEEKQLLVLQNEQFRQTLEGQNVLIYELQKALLYNQEMHKHHEYDDYEADHKHHEYSDHEDDSQADSSQNSQKFPHHRNEKQFISVSAQHLGAKNNQEYREKVQYTEPDIKVSKQLNADKSKHEGEETGKKVKKCGIKQKKKPALQMNFRELQLLSSHQEDVATHTSHQDQHFAQDRNLNHRFENGYIEVQNLQAHRPLYSDPSSGASTTVAHLPPNF